MYVRERQSLLRFVRVSKGVETGLYTRAHGRINNRLQREGFLLGTSLRAVLGWRHGTERDAMSAQNIFVSYRRGADEYAAGALARDLKASFGDEAVFLDVDNLAKSLGVDFHDLLEERVAECTAFIAVIGPGWVEAMPRLGDDEDWVRIETATALAREGLRVVPVLVGGAQMPDRDALPGDLQELPRRQSLVIRHGDWAHDIGKLTRALEGQSGDRDNHPVRPTKIIMALAGVAVVGAATMFFWEDMINARCSMAAQPWEIAYCG